MVDYLPKAVEALLGEEGGLANHPADSGGETNHGITKATAAAYHYHGPMADIPIDLVYKIYRVGYWDRVWGDKVAEIYPDVAYELFEAGVLSGWSVAGKWLQRILNVNNDGGRLYRDLPVTGNVREMTLAALTAYAGHRGADGETVMLVGQNSLQGAYLVELAERRQKDEAFVYGWLLHRASIARPLQAIGSTPHLEYARHMRRYLCI